MTEKDIHCELRRPDRELAVLRLARVARRNALNDALQGKRVVSALLTFGLVTRGSSTREMDRSQRDVLFRWRQIIKHNGFSADS